MKKTRFNKFLNEEILKTLLYAEALKVFGNERASHFAQRHQDLFHTPAVPVNFEYGRGIYLYDAQKRPYIDIANYNGITLAGHNNPVLKRALAKAASGPLCTFGVRKDMIDLAELLCDRFELDGVSFWTAGSEATLEALRIAREATGRRKVLKVAGCYHAADWYGSISSAYEGDENPCAIAEPRPLVPGTAAYKDDLVVLGGWTTKALHQAFAAHGEELAAVFIEPFVGSLGYLAAPLEFLQAARKLCDRYGVVLVWDEVWCGAVVGVNGAYSQWQKHLNEIRPDLRCLAKGIAAGAPFAVCGGSYALMTLRGACDISSTATYYQNRISIAAAHAMLQKILTPENHRALSERSQYFAERLNEELAMFHLEAKSFGLGGSIRPNELWLRSPAEQGIGGVLDSFYDLFWLRALDDGLVSQPGFIGWTLSTPYLEDEGEEALDTAVEKVVTIVKDILQECMFS